MMTKMTSRPPLRNPPERSAGGPPGECVQLRILRDGEEASVEVPVQPLQRLVPHYVYDQPQPYFIYGGLVFVPLSEPYLQEWGDDWLSDAPQELVELAMSGIQTKPGEEPVIFSRCFPSRRTAGFTGLTDRRVLSVNGEPVLNLRQMYETVQREAGRGAHLQFELHCVGGSALLALETVDASEVTEEILRTYRVPQAAAPELLQEAQE